MTERPGGLTSDVLQVGPLGLPHTGGYVDRDQTTSERLLTNAAELFRRKGYAGTTTRELSAVLGLQNASLYHHISGKEDILFNLCIGALEHVSRVIDEVLDASEGPLNSLEHLAIRYTEAALEDRDRHATMLIELRSLSPERRTEVIALRASNVERAQALMAAGQRVGEIRSDIEPKYLTLAFFNLLNWSIFWWRPNGDITSTELAKILWAVFSGGAKAADR
jgi:AcrR family transcriptional regulator